MKTTLQTRLIILMIMSSIFLIAAFTAIQINNQLQRVQEYNIYRAKQEALVAKDKLQDLFSSLDKEQSQSFLISKVKEIFASLLESETIETAMLLDKEGKPAVLEGKLKLVFEDDESFLREVSEIKDKSKWLVPLVDKKHRLVSLFVTVDNPYGYIVKLTFSLTNLQAALNEVYGPVIFTIIIVVIGNIILAALLSKVLISPVKLLNQATKDIADGNLERKIFIDTGDELEELANTFNYMTVELKKMKERAENANPLTKFPGNIVIREEVEKRIKNGDKFVLIYCDLDNFKAFNDKYGVGSGDEAVILTAEILKEAIKTKGKADDFIGHEGGDDFLLLSEPQRAKDLTDYIITEFDRRIRRLYKKEDLERGYIEGKARDTGQLVKFPIMSISLAGISNVVREITSYAQITNIAAEVKKAAKLIKGSKFLMDRRFTDFGKQARLEGPPTA